jgi:L-glyceraldehyde 3-phosphate reductase
VDAPDFTEEELCAIDRWAVDSDVNIWWGVTASTR